MVKALDSLAGLGAVIVMLVVAPLICIFVLDISVLYTTLFDVSIPLLMGRAGVFAGSFRWLMVAALAHLYQSSVNRRRPEFPRQSGEQQQFGFRSNSMDCCADCTYCAYGFFCAPC
eukprot:1495462-Amphidinium_carterae.1